MTAPSQALALRRGACPGLSAPMPTGDGLLVRLQPTGTVSLAAFAAFCAAARRHGNGIIEVTSRGNIQVRGLSEGSAPRFAADIAALDIAAAEGIPVHCNALAGIGAHERLDAQALATELRHALSQRSLAERLSPKVCVAIDGGSAPGLAKLSADVRLCAQKLDGGIVLRVAVGGDGENAIGLGTVDPAHGVAVAVRLLEIIARRGHDSRARDIIAAEGAAEFRAALAGLLPPDSDLDARMRRDERDVIGTHALRDGLFACGIGLAFGHSDAGALERLIGAASELGASGFRAAPGRALLAIGIARDIAARLAAAAEKLGFISRAGDPRRRIVACAGAPICGSAYIAARAMAPDIAAAVAPFPDGATTIHVSGCAKGCAHAASAALTVVGTGKDCALIANGTARDAPFARVAADELTAAVARFVQTATKEVGHV